MKIWPWSEIAELKKALRISRAQTAACGLAAVGEYYLFLQEGQFVSPDIWSDSLIAVIKLRNELDKYPKPPPEDFDTAKMKYVASYAKGRIMTIRTVEELISSLQKENPKSQVCIHSDGLARELDAVEADRQLDLVVLWAKDIA